MAASHSHARRIAAATFLTPFVAQLMTSTALATQCGANVPSIALAALAGAQSIAAIENSTAQALELQRKRREEAAPSCAAGFTLVAGNCVATPTPVAAVVPSPAPAQPVIAAPAAAPPPAVTVVAPPPAAPAAPVIVPAAPVAAPVLAQPAPIVVTQAQPPVSTMPAKVIRGPAAAKDLPSVASTKPSKDPVKRIVRASAAPPKKHVAPHVVYEKPVEPAPTRGAWVSAFADSERQSNLAPGVEPNLVRHVRTTGVVVGSDMTRRNAAAPSEFVVMGLLGGAARSDAKFSDGPTVIGVPNGNGDLFDVTERDRRQTTEGVFLGGYGSYVRDRFSIDMLAKAEIFDLTRRFVTEADRQGCNDPPELEFNAASTSFVSYSLAANIQERRDIGHNWWLEPTAGFRFSYVDFAGSASALGLKDGHVLRLQAGVRIGTSWMMDNARPASFALTGLLYSDVIVNGFVAPGGLATGSSSVDEGKIRGMLIADTKLSLGRGLTFEARSEVRGGENLFGYGGRVGLRYEW